MSLPIWRYTIPPRSESYQQQAAATVAQHGGKYLVLGGEVGKLEGNWPTARPVIIELPNFDAARTWYQSAEYQAIAPVRHRTAKSVFCGAASTVPSQDTSDLIELYRHNTWANAKVFDLAAGVDPQLVKETAPGTT